MANVSSAVFIKFVCTWTEEKTLLSLLWLHVCASVDSKEFY